MLAQPPLTLGHFDIESVDVDRRVARLAAFVPFTDPFTDPFNVTGQPAASVPLLWSADGLPIGWASASPATTTRRCCCASPRSSNGRGRGSTGARPHSPDPQAQKKSPCSRPSNA